MEGLDDIGLTLEKADHIEAFETEHDPPPLGLSRTFLVLDCEVRHGRACPGHPRLFAWTPLKSWMPGTRPGMTRRDVLLELDRL